MLNVQTEFYCNIKEYLSFSFDVAVMVYHWKSTVDFVKVDVDGDVPGAEVKGMKV